MKKGEIFRYVLTFMLLYSLIHAQDYAFNKVSMDGYQDYRAISTPANPPSGVVRWYQNSATNILSCLRSDGTDCNPLSPTTIISGRALFPPRPNENYFIDVNNPAVQVNSIIISNISRSGVGCNLEPESLFGAPVIVSKTPSVGFRLSIGGLPIDSPLCVDYIILTSVN